MKRLTLKQKTENAWDNYMEKLNQIPKICVLCPYHSKGCKIYESTSPCAIMEKDANLCYKQYKKLKRRLDIRQGVLIFLAAIGTAICSYILIAGVLLFA